ncbi:Dabb family protein [Nitratireductor pacificus]|uniref:Stress responsive alpha-beta barrel n=1 Tax=Nitratireductor pacificus pht-3B TaxID=391937 RepID=K2NA46_9HYPH|nr:Dabb family protein [Nitratireductor pacificus]EKF20993.1 stress responsive alpha-beta barrel [Nitratireductor pacificus pht-3B]
MIRHIVFFSARDEADVGRIADKLGMLGDIPHADFFEVGLNRKVDQLGSEVDVVVYGEFRDEEALAAYKAHPVYAECIRQVRPLREMRIAADFVSSVSTAPRVLLDAQRTL